MNIKQLIYEDFVNYKYPSMFIGTGLCDWKCCYEQHVDISVCQNTALITNPFIEVPNHDLYRRYIDNPITKSIVIGGLEPMLQFNELTSLIRVFRNNNCMDDIVIYTGYYAEEIEDKIKHLKVYPNIIIKFGRYLIGQSNHYDPVLGVELASENQYGAKIS